MIKTCYMRIPYLPRNVGYMYFLFLILDAKIPKFTYVKFEKKTDIKLRDGGPQRV